MFCALHGLLLHFKLIPEGVKDKGDNPLVELERAKVRIPAVSRLYLGCISGVSRQARELRKVSTTASTNGHPEVSEA